MKAVTYLKKNLDPGFIQSWKGLTNEDKSTLKEWAVTEGKVLGIPVENED